MAGTPNNSIVRGEEVAQALASEGTYRAAAKKLGMAEQSGGNALALQKYVDRNPGVKERAQEIIQTRYAEQGITAKRVMTELARVAFASAKDVFDKDGNLIPIHEMSDDAAASISGIDVELHKVGRGDDATYVTVKKIRRADKMSALNTLAKHFKIVGDEGDGVNALASALADRLNAAKRRMQPGQFEEATAVVRDLPAVSLLDQPADIPLRPVKRSRKAVRSEPSEGTVTADQTEPPQENDDGQLW